MKNLLLFAILSATASATTYSNTQSGNASATSTWGGAGPPGNGDTVIISTGTVVTVDRNMTWGTSGANGTTAVTQLGTGQLVIGAGVFFTIRGNFLGHGNTNTTPLVLMNPGSTWQFDSSQAASPMSTQYEFASSNFGAYVYLQSVCTAIARCSVQSNAGGGAGYFDGSVPTQTGGMIAAYTDFLRIDHFYPSFFSGGTVWNVTNSTFNFCGIIQSIAQVGLGTIFVHNNNVHTNTIGASVLYATFTGGSVGSGGVRQIENNVFDQFVGANTSGGGWSEDSVTITGNYFGQCLQPVEASGIWALFEYNLVRETTGCLTASGDMLDNYIIEDLFAPAHDHNPDVSQTALNVNILRNIFDNTFFNLTGNPSIDGVVLYNVGVGTAVSATIKNNLVLPTGNGVGGQSLIDIDGPNTATLDIEHNTMACALTACVQMEYENPDLPNGIAHRGILSNNIFYSQANQANTAAALNANIENPITDLFAPSSIQNNARFNILALGCVTDCGFGGPSTNQGNGYWGAWSVTPGASDVVGNPLFRDTTRNMATFDTAYLGHVASATWVSEASGHNFSVGDIISDQSSSYYASSLINYRAIASFAKSTPNSEPGVGSAWHTYWEFASLNTIRNAIASGATITDAATGASNASYIVALTDWVRAGFAPESTALHGAATDSTDIGAVPFTLPSPPAFAKAFGAPSIALAVTTSLTFTISNPNMAVALSAIAFTDTLPAGVAVSGPSGLTNTCGGTATAAAGVVSLSGASLSAAGACAVTLNVTALTAGTWTNTTGAITASESGTGLTASAILVVTPPSPPSMSTAFGAASIAPAVTTSLTFTIANQNLTTTLTGVAFTDTLPAGLAFATPNGLASSCGGTALVISATLSLSGGAIGLNSACSISLNVEGLLTGTWTNVSGPVTAVNTSGSGAGSAAALIVTNVVLTPILDTVMNIDGSLLSGDIIVINTPFLIGSTSIAGGRTVFPITNGIVNFSLVPTDNSNPATAYSVQTVSNGQTSISTWSVPTTNTPQTISEIVNNLFAPVTTLALSKLSLFGSQYGYGICNLNGAASWCPPGSAAWGSISGTLSSQADLVAALAAKLGVSATAVNSTEVGGITITGTPTVGWVPTATSSTAATWQAPSGGGGGGGTWGSITGTLSSQTDLNTALAGKQASLGYTPLNAASNLSDLVTPATARTNLGVAIGSNVEAWSANLDTWSSKTPPAGTVIGTTDTQTLTNKTVDGVAPATIAFLDATSSIQAQLNAKQASLGYTAENVANKDANSGYAGLTSGGLLKTAEAPTWNQSTTGTAANSTAIGGVAISGTPSSGYIPTATGSSTATWQLNASATNIGSCNAANTAAPNALTCTIAGFTLASGSLINLFVAVANTSSTVTLIINGGSTLTIFRGSGNSPSVGQISHAGTPLLLSYNGTSLQIVNDYYEPDSTNTLCKTVTGFPWTWGVCPGTFFGLTASNAPTGYNNFVNGQIRFPEATIAAGANQLPSASANASKEFVVLDGVNATDCTIGGGSTRVNACYSTGAAWAFMGSSAPFTNFQGDTGNIAQTGSAVTIYSVSLPALAADACFAISTHLTLGTSGSTTIQILVDATLIATPESALGNDELLVSFNICNNPGSQTAQSNYYSLPLFYAAAGTMPGSGGNVAGSNTDAGQPNLTSAINFAAAHTLTIKTTAASGNTVGRNFHLVTQ